MPETKEGTAKAVEKDKLSKEEFDAQIAQLQLESARLEIEYKKANLQDMAERLAERNLKRETVGQRAKINGATIKQLAHNRELVQARCNHRKGGNGAVGVIAGQGDDSQYAVLKHIMANGDTWVRCLRCGKWWIPPMKDSFETTEGYLGAVAEYQAALNFQTRNSTSSSVMFKWGDNGEFYRQQMKNTINT